jgi:putative flippase GtrA
VQQRHWELLRFGLVGAFNAGTYFGLYSAGVLIGVPYVLSAIVAFALSASLGYWLHEHWTFKGMRPTVRGWISWIAAQATATGLNLLLLILLVDGFGVHKILAQLVLLPVPPAATYLVGRRYVFSRARSSAAAPPPPAPPYADR